MHTFVQTTERGASATPKNACLKCGRSKEWHEFRALAPEGRADAWLERHGIVHGHPLHEMLRKMLTTFIKEVM